MTNNPHRCVIDRNGSYKDFVLLTEQADENGSVALKPYMYTMLEGESLLDTQPPSNFIRPRWDGNGWTEAASEEELETARQERLALETQNRQPTLEERVSIMEDALLDVLTAGGAR